MQYEVTNSMRNEAQHNLKTLRDTYFADRRVSGPLQETRVVEPPLTIVDDELKPLLGLLRSPVAETWTNLEPILTLLASHSQLTKRSHKTPSTSSEQVNQDANEDGIDPSMEAEMDAQQDAAADRWNLGDKANEADWEDGEWDGLVLYS